MLNFIQFLINREAKPLALAAAQAVSQPTKRAVARLVWAAGFGIAALILSIAGIGIGAIALSALLLEKLPDVQSVFGWSASALIGVAIILAILATWLTKTVSPQHMMREGQQIFDHERKRATSASYAHANGKARASAADPVSDSYAFARGFADGLRH